MRLGLSFRLNYNTPKGDLNVVDTEHRVRLWWSIYIMDRFWGLRNGLPVQVSDDDIHVDLPETPACYSPSEQFADPALQIAGIGLARLAGNISQDLYGPRKPDESFIQREQKLLIRSKQWIEALPDDLKLLSIEPNRKNIIVMHLQFNYVSHLSWLNWLTLINPPQCIMLAISPALLHMLSSKAETGLNPIHTSTALLTVTEACVHAAKHSVALCSEAWTSGSIGMYSYDFPGFLFTAALALLVCAYIQQEPFEAVDGIDTVREVLQTLSSCGNLSARDFFDHLNFVIECFEGARKKPSTLAAEVGPRHHEDVSTSLLTPASGPLQVSHEMCNSGIDFFGNSDASMSDADIITMQAAFNQANMQDFLSQADTSFAHADSTTFLDDPMSSFWWLDKPLYIE